MKVIIICLILSAFYSKGISQKIPKNIKQACRFLDKNIDSLNRELILTYSEDSVAIKIGQTGVPDFFYDWGLANPNKTHLTKYFAGKGIVIPYDMYEAILISLRRFLKTQPINFMQTVQKIKNRRASENYAYHERINYDTFISINHWHNHPLPNDLTTLEQYNMDTIDWVVHLIDNEVWVNKGLRRVKNILPFRIKDSERKRYNLYGKYSVLEVDDGFLVGFDRGEWGGCLYWFSKNGKRKYKISNDQVVDFFKQGNKIYAIQGLAHLSISRGSIIEISKEKERWISSVYLKLRFAPQGVGFDSKGNLIIITSKNLLQIDQNGTINELIEEGFWQAYLYPNSIVVLNDTAFVGMRRGVLKFDLITGHQYWMMGDSD